MKTKTILLLSALIVIPTHGAVIAFDPLEGFKHGTVLDNPTIVAGPIETTITVASNGNVNRAFVFDSSAPLPADPDLFVGLGMGIAISEDGTADDEAKGGKITFDFSRPINSFTFTGVDLEEGASVFVGRGDLLFSVPSLRTDDQSATDPVTLIFSDLEVTTVSLRPHGSGAFADILVTASPVPEPGIALFSLAGLGILAARRRRERV